MKTIYLREIRHIVANHSLRNQATGYRRDSKSITVKSIQNLIKSNWLECKNNDGPFLFVIPSKKLITAFGIIAIENKMSAIPELNKSLTEKKTAQDFSFK